MKILSLFGTRPEAIKMAPVLRALRRHPNLQSIIALTGQHRDLVTPVLDAFELQADRDLALMQEGQSLAGFHGRALAACGALIEREQPDWVLVHGDTASALAAATAAFYAGIPVGHVEAGLRTGDLRAPFPEEMNRRAIAMVAERHFAPTERARDALIAEGVTPSRIAVTGNSAVDAVRWMAQTHERARACVEPHKRLILVTGHRRENFGPGLAGICEALVRLAARGDVEIVYPIHPNPAVRGPVSERLAGVEHLWLVDPFDYPDMVAAMSGAHLILTDSGGIQEEAAALGIPVIVMRDKTERPEAVEAGCALVGGTEPTRLTAIASRLLDDCRIHRSMAIAPCPFGDGRTGERIADWFAAQASSQSMSAASVSSLEDLPTMRGNRSVASRL